MGLQEQSHVDGIGGATLKLKISLQYHDSETEMWMAIATDDDLMTEHPRIIMTHRMVAAMVAAML